KHELAISLHCHELTIFNRALPVQYAIPLYKKLQGYFIDRGTISINKVLLTRESKAQDQLLVLNDRSFIEVINKLVF
ncbi:MAG: hypothetical protein KDD40_05920, partial [Bdellovibrionales bacterium]|nr:hypothetical protein [Bdellovibrionales bacterium]